MPTMEESYKFEQLSPAEKIEARISWLQRKMVEVLWLLIGAAALLAGALAAWFVGEAMEMRSIWIYAPVGLVVWGVVKIAMISKRKNGLPSFRRRFDSAHPLQSNQAIIDPGATPLLIRRDTNWGACHTEIRNRFGLESRPKLYEFALQERANSRHLAP